MIIIILSIILIILIIVSIFIDVKSFNSLNTNIKHIQFRIDSIEKRINELYNKLSSIDADIMSINDYSKANYNLINSINNKLIIKAKSNTRNKGKKKPSNGIKNSSDK